MLNKIVVDKNKLNNYKLKLTTLSPVHIGTGDVYDPTNYIIDENKLYKFDEVLFYKSLDVTSKKKFDTKINSNDYMQIIDFYKSKKQEAKSISYFECQVSSQVQTAYNKQINKDGTRNSNQLQIDTTFKNPNTFRAIIPGSSIKGMIGTAMKIYPRKIEEYYIRQNLIISDAISLNGDVEIGYMRRTDRDKDQIIQKRGGISSIVETIKENSEFIFTINSKFKFDEIKENIKNYHSKRENSIYQESQNSFIARVGKFSGMDYVVDNIKDAKQPRTNKPLGTHSLYDFDNDKLKQFGWIKIELIEDDEYQKALEDISNQEKNYFIALEDKQKAIKNTIQKSKDEAIKAQRDKEERDKKEAEALENAKRKREIELASMSSIDKIIDSFDNDIVKVINAMKDASIENLEEIKIELANKLKTIMQKDPKQWDKAKQKALKRKEYIQSILGK